MIWRGGHTLKHYSRCPPPAQNRQRFLIPTIKTRRTSRRPRNGRDSPTRVFNLNGNATYPHATSEVAWSAALRNSTDGLLWRWLGRRRPRLGGQRIFGLFQQLLLQQRLPRIRRIFA